MRWWARGLVKEFTLDGKTSRYDANLEAHHHFVCDQCEAVEDVDWFEIPHPAGHDVRSAEVVFRGVCEKCR
jgi:Fe2+ or Zn2+ uptake regulation protein